MTKNHKELLEDEWYHVRYSGEIPEIALHSSLYYLTEDKDGPRIVLEEDDCRKLNDAAMLRYKEIILRDITQENRDTTIYRGVLRSISNWRRYKRFCYRHELQVDLIRDEVAQSLMMFLRTEIAQVQAGERQSCINCTFEDLQSFALELEVSLADLEKDLRPICLDF
ncbi:MAG: hypothetical protein V2I36_18330 [Desulfopila sp.]|jgi:hypothetical protein|nr:hypothetical protein [Desulfopila sp.]